MKKRILSLLFVTILAVAVFAPVVSLADTMYVWTPNGGALYERDQPSPDGRILLAIPYGEQFYVYNFDASGWAYGHYGGEFGWVMSRYLVAYNPGPYKPAVVNPTATPKPQKTDEQKAAEALKTERNSYRDLAKSITIAARPERSTGWVNFREGPGAKTTRIATFQEGKQLIAIGETNKWYKATDPDTGKTGYVSKNYVTVLPDPIVVATAAPKDPNAKETLGTLNVNGAFTLQCKLPAGYDMQVVNMKGSKIIASINPTDTEKPILYLSVAYNDLYANVKKMNDMSAEDLAVLERSFTEQDDVEISYRETAYGTKLLVAREVGSDTDFVDILSVYQGYFIEFVMTPNPGMASKTLTDEQVRMCIDFLTDLDFVPAK